jgi:hypothetical protein
MLIGFNNDVEYNGRMFHIQTEDNGLKNASITTILFYQGQILDRRSTGYGDIAKQHTTNEEERNKAVKKRMVELHRALYKNLFDGMYEEQTDRLAAAKGLDGGKPPRPTTPDQPTPRVNPGASSPAMRSPGDSGSDLPRLAPMPTPDDSFVSNGRPLSNPKLPSLTNVAGTRSQPVASVRPSASLRIEWMPTGINAFRGIPAVGGDLRIDALVAEFLDTLS